VKRFRRPGKPSVAKDDGLPFTLSEDDLAAIQPGTGPPSTVLGYASGALELLLERSLILARLRAKGFPNLRVDILTPDSAGHTLRIVSLDGAGDLLVEVRVSRSRNRIPGMEVIALEWLLLQNPREGFSDGRPRLPGQQHPGLGLLRDVVGWLFVVCEQHHLDGIYFVAAHYHVAMQSRRVFRFLKPEDEARTRAFAATLDGLTLAEATDAIAAGRVMDEVMGRPAAWEPTALVLPASERLRAEVGGEEREARVQAALRRFRFRLIERPWSSPAP
jgi:hypothetical protein